MNLLNLLFPASLHTPGHDAFVPPGCLGMGKLLIRGVISPQISPLLGPSSQQDLMSPKLNPPSFPNCCPLAVTPLQPGCLG